MVFAKNRKMRCVDMTCLAAASFGYQRLVSQAPSEDT